MGKWFSRPTVTQAPATDPPDAPSHTGDRAPKVRPMSTAQRPPVRRWLEGGGSTE